MSFEDYLADPCPEPSLSRSTIKDLITKCPAKAFNNHPRLNPDCERDTAKKFDIGTAAHDLFLGGEGSVMVFDYADWKKNEAKEAREAARSIGKTPLLRHQYDDAMKMVEAAHIALFNFAMNGEKQMLMVDQGASELTYLWQEKETWFRIRPDLIFKDRHLVFDYKTTEASAYPEDYVGIITGTGLDIQDAFYSRGIEAVEGWEPERFIFMVQEVNAPYLCSFLELDMMFHEMGRDKVERGLKIWRECMASGEWPGYSNHLYTVEPKPWALASWELRKHQEAA